MALKVTDDRLCPCCGFKFKDSDKLISCPECKKEFDIKEKENENSCG